MHQRLIKLSSEAEWNRALQGIPHTYSHTHWYNQAMHMASQRDIVLYHGETQDFSVVCPLLLRHKNSNDAVDVTTPYGFSGFASKGQYQNFHQDWYQFMYDNQFVCGHIALHPLYSLSNLYDEKNIYSGKKSYFINLTQSLDQIEKKFSSDHRHRLRQFYKSKLIVSHEKNENIMSAFIKLYSEGLKERQAAAIYDFGEAAWRAILISEASILFSVTVDHAIEAVAVFILHDNMADYYMIASTRSGRAFARPIIAEALNYFKEKNVQWLSLGCGVRENDDLELFKARFGGEAYTTYALKQIYHASAYEALCQRYNVDSKKMSGYFPSYWMVST